MVTAVRDSMTIFHLLAPQRTFLSEKDAVTKYERPRPSTAGQTQNRRSIVSTSSQSTTHTTDSIPTRKPSFTTNPDIPHLIKTPWELERSKKGSLWKRTTRSEPQSESYFPAHVFKRLPREVYDCVVEKLEELHLEQDQSCPSCYLRDLHSLSLTSRAWDRAANVQLYKKVWVLTNEEHEKLPKVRVKGTSRLKLLRRTLRERHALAQCVKELHMPDFQALYQSASIEREEIVNLVASLVMACPNLERLVGFHIPFTHTYDRLSHALSTRPRLKERVWLLSENEFELEEEEDDRLSGYYFAGCDPNERFLEHNASNPNLTTLVLHQQQTNLAEPLTFRALIGTFRKLPALRHLSISGLPNTSFTNLALNSLPPYLQSLRLENLPGINDKGLQRFATSPSATSLESLILINIEISNLLTISNLLSPHLARLERFSLSQCKEPGFPSGSFAVPDLQSPNLKYIHWEIRSQAGPPPTLMSPSSRGDRTSFPFTNDEPISCLATSLLATGIRNGLFPSLRKIRAPHDPQGLLQALCKPLATALLPSDASLLTSLLRRSSSSSSSSSHKLYIDGHCSIGYPKLSTTIVPTSPRADSPMSATFDIDITNDSGASKATLQIPLSTTLTPSHSRLAAQSRLLAARKEPFMTIQVVDPNGEFRVNKTIGGYLGDVRSDIWYELRPDRNRVTDMSAEDADEDEEDQDYAMNEWITDISDIAGEWEVVSGNGQSSCYHLVSGRADRKAISVEEMF